MRLSLPSSIVLASLLIALGLYFGLRASPPDGAEPMRPAPAPSLPGEPGPLRDVTALPQVPRDEQLRAEVTALVADAKPRWKTACWDTADPVMRKPGRYVSTLAFDAGGKLTVSGVGELRDGSDPTVAQCIRLLVNDFRISAPGKTVTFEVPFEIP